MRTFLALLFLFPFWACGQNKEEVNKETISAIYVQVIGDFIKAANQKNNSVFDTLYFGNRKYGQPDDFPDIELPSIIENTVIKLISPEEGLKSQNDYKSRKYVNLIGWVDKDQAEFVIYVFSNGFQHQYNYKIQYNYNKENRKYNLVNKEFHLPTENR